MKTIFLMLLMQLSILAYSQEVKSDPPLLEWVFLKKIDVGNRIIQNDGKRRMELTPFIDDKYPEFKKYLLTSYNENNEADGSQYIISKKGIDKSFNLFNISMDLNVVYFDKAYLEDDNLGKSKTGKMIIHHNQSPFEMNTPLSKLAVKCDEGSEPICIDWYWQTWENGVLTNEEYLYTTCDQCGGGGGGNSGPWDPTLSCDERTEAFANQGNSMSGPVGSLGVPPNEDTWVIPYNWKIYSAGTWGLVSYEEGSLVRVQYGNKRRWEYQTFTHKNIAEIGSSFGGTRTFAEVTVNINITATKTAVYERLDYSVTSTVLIPSGIPIVCPPVTLLYNANKIFHAPNNYVIVN